MKKIFFLAAATIMACAANANQKFNASTVASTAQQVANATATAANVAANVEAAKTGAANLSAVDAGKGAGTALQALLAQYKVDGKFDYKNISNYTQTIALLNDCAQLPTNVKNSAYLKEFGQGLIQSTAGLVNTGNVEQVTNSLTNLASQYADKAAAATNSVSEKLATTAAAANTLSTLLAGFGK